MSDISLKVTSDSSQAREDLSRLSRSVSNIENQTIKTTEGLARLGKQIGLAFVGFASVSSIVRLTDSLTNLDNRIALVTGRTRELAEVQRELFRVSFRTGTQIAANAAVFNKFGISLKKVGVDSTNILRATETIAQTIRLSGSSAESANAAIIQLGQGLSSGTLRGEELNSVLEQLPRLAQAIADELNIGVGELRKMGEQGKITSATVFKAIRNQADVINKEFQTLNSTIGTATTRLTLAFSLLAGTLDRSTGFSKTIANLINAFATAVFSFAERLPLRLRIITNEFEFFYRRVKYFLEDIIDSFDDLADASQLRFGVNFDFDSAIRVIESLRKIGKELSNLFDFSIDTGKLTNKLNATFQVIATIFAGSLNVLYAVLNATIAELTTNATINGLLTTTIGLIDSGLNTLSASIDTIVDRVGRVYDRLFESTLPTKVRFGLAFKEAFDLSYFELLDFYNRYTKTVDDLFEQFDNISNYVLSIDLQAYLPSLEQVKEKLKDFYDFVIGVFANIYDLVVGNSYWPDTLDGVLAYTKQIIPKVVNIITDFGRTIITRFKSIYASISDLEISVKVREFISQARQDITSNLTFDNLENQIKRLSIQFREFINTFSTGNISQTSNKVFSQLKEFFDNISDVKIPVVASISGFVALLLSTTGPLGKLVAVFATIQQSVRESPTRIKTVFEDFVKDLQDVSNSLVDFSRRVIAKPEEVVIDLKEAFSEGLINSSAFSSLSELFSGIIGRAFGRATGQDSYTWKENLLDAVAGVLLFAFNSTFRRLVTISAVIQLAKGDKSVSEFLQDILFRVADFGNQVLAASGVTELLNIKNDNGPLGLIAGLLFGAIGVAFFSKTVRSFLFGLLKIDFEAKRIRDALGDVLGPQTGNKIARGLANQESKIAGALRGFIKLGSIAGGVGGAIGSIYVSEFIKETFEIKDPLNQLAVDFATLFISSFLGAKAIGFLGTSLSNLLLKKLKVVDTNLSRGGVSLGKRIALAIRTGVLSLGLFGGFLSGYLLGEVISDKLGIEDTFARIGVSIASGIFAGIVGYQLAKRLRVFFISTVIPAIIGAFRRVLVNGIATVLFAIPAIKAGLAATVAAIASFLSLPVILTALGIAAGTSLLYSIFFGSDDSLGGKVRSFFSSLETDLRKLLGLPEKIASETAPTQVAELEGGFKLGIEESTNELNNAIDSYERLLASEFGLPIRITEPDMFADFKGLDTSLSNLELGQDPLNLEATTSLITLTKRKDPFNFESLEDVQLPEVLLNSDVFEKSVKAPVETLSEKIEELNDTINKTTDKQVIVAEKVSAVIPQASKTEQIVNNAISKIIPPAAASTPSTLAGRKLIDPLSEFIKGKEGFNPTAFFDVKQFSIGFGTKALTKEEESGKVKISMAEAERRLKLEIDKISRVVDTIDKKFNYQFTENQKAALISFTYNLGPGNLNKLIAGGTRTKEEISAKIPEYKFAGGEVLPGLVTRRLEEQAIFNSLGDFSDELDNLNQKLKQIQVNDNIAKFASGGYISGSGGPRSDLIPAMLSNGEYVVNAAATRKFGPILNAINSGNIAEFANGSEVKASITNAALNVSDVVSANQNKIFADLLLRVNFDEIDDKSFRDISRAFSQIAREKANIERLNESLNEAFAKGKDDEAQKIQDRLEESEEVISRTMENITDRVNDFAKQTPKQLDELFKKEQSAFAKEQVEAIRQSFQSSLTNLLSGKIGIGEFGKSVLNDISMELIKGFSKSISDTVLGSTGSLTEVFNNLFRGNLETGNKVGKAVSSSLGLGKDAPNGTETNPLIVKAQEGISALLGKDKDNALKDPLKDVAEDVLPTEKLEENTTETKNIFSSFTDGLSSIFSKENPLLKGFGDIFSNIGGLFSGGAGGGGLTGILTSIGGLFGFADGGIVPANSSGAMPVIAHAGEIILNEAQQARIASAMQNGSSGQQVVNVNITGDISRQTKSEIYKMLPSIAEGVNSHNREKGYR